MEEYDASENTEPKTAVELPDFTNFLNLEEQGKLMLDERNKLEEDFGQQRAKLKDLYIQKEEEVKFQLQKNLILAADNEQKTSTICQLKRELDDLRSQVIIVQCTAENEIEVERRKCMEEIASITKILKEELSATESEVDELRKKVKYLEIEKYHYRGLYEQKLEEGELKREESILSTGRLSTVTKNFVKKVPALNTSNSHSASHDSSSLQLLDCSPNSSVSLAQGESLEESMKKAQESTTVLKSLVVPLEEEISALKDKIRDQDAQLRVKEAQDQLALNTSDMIGFLLRGQPFENLIKELDSKLHGMKTSLNAEKATRADLELYAAMMNTQKTALTGQVERQREQLQDLRKMYNEERKKCSELKTSLQNTSSRLIEEQRMYLFKMRNIRSFLTVEQLRKMHDIMEENTDEQDVAIESSANLLSFTEEDIAANKFQVQTENSKFVYEDSLTEQSMMNISNKDIVCINLPSDKLPQLTDDQKRALSGTTDCAPEQLLEIESPKISSTPRVVNEGEWLLLQNEITTYQKLIAEECKSCIQLDSNLKMVEAELKDSNKRKTTAEKAITKIKVELERETEYRKKSEIKWRQLCLDFERKEKILQLKVDQSVTHHKEIISTSKRGFEMVQEQSNELTKKRASVNNELIRLQEENDTLVKKHSIRSQELQNEIINLPDTMEDMQLLLLKYREDVIAAKVAKEHLEETLNSKLLFLYDQLEGEQHERATMEMKLSLEIDQLRAKAEMSENLEEKLLNEKQILIQTEEKLKIAEQKGIDSINRSQLFITGLKSQIEEHEQKKSEMGMIIADLKSRVYSLQHDLKTSEAVQRDFVRLSQSLQVHLEKIRQSDKEVRWQHEDDIDDCNRCNQKFNTIGRRKHHCKHCGRIFCPECITKTVTSGPNRRPSKVCDVCHTLLVHDATPFFSTEPPHSPIL